MVIAETLSGVLIVVVILAGLLILEQPPARETAPARVR